MSTSPASLKALISTHDATRREYATALARNDINGAKVASEQLSEIGQQIDAAAMQNISDIKSQLNLLNKRSPEIREQARNLSIEAAKLGRLASQHLPTQEIKAKLLQSQSTARREAAKSMALLTIFITLALYLILGFYSAVIIVGLAVLFLIYKPFSASFRWQNIYQKVRAL